MFMLHVELAFGQVGSPLGSPRFVLQNVCQLRQKAGQERTLKTIENSQEARSNQSSIHFSTLSDTSLQPPENHGEEKVQFRGEIGLRRIGLSLMGRFRQGSILVDPVYAEFDFSCVIRLDQIAFGCLGVDCLAHTALRSFRKSTRLTQRN